MRVSRIDKHDAPLNPGRRQQEYRFALPRLTTDKLEAADIKAAMRNALYRTLQLCGTFMFDNRTGSVCERRHVMAHLQKHMAADTARKHLRILERLNLISMAGSLFSFEHYSEANPTAGEAQARYAARLSQLRSAQRRHRAKKRASRVVFANKKAQRLRSVAKSVITQKTSKQAPAAEAAARPFAAIYKSFSGHSRELLHPRVVYQALIEAENDIFDREAHLAEGVNDNNR